MSNFIFLAWAWCAANGVTLDLRQEPQWMFTDVCDGKGYCLTDWRVAGVPRPTLDQLRALQPQADAKAAQVAAEPQDVTVGKVRLRTHADGAVELIDGPLILPGSASGAYEVWVDAETGLVLSVLDHASPRKSKAEKDAAKQAKRDQIKAVKAAQTDKDKLAALLKLLGLAP